MKLLCALLMLAVSASAADYSDGIKYAIEQLRLSKTADGVPVMGGHSSNYGGVHGTFYLLWPFFFARATREDVELMLKDPNPLVRILGARRVLTPFLRPLPIAALDPLAKDTAEVRVGPLYEPNEHFATMTVAAVVEEMKKDPQFLFKPYFGEQVRLDYLLEAQPLRSVKAEEFALPTFPPDMARARIAGEVTLRLTVQADGSVTDAAVVKSSQREFEPAAKSAALKWRFSRSASSEESKATPTILECRLHFGFKDE